MRRTLLPLAVVASVLAGCGGTSTSTDATAQPQAVVTTGETPTTTGGSTVTADSNASGTDSTSAAAATAPEALQFAAPLVGGGNIDFTQFAGRTVALWFWAPT